MKCVHRIAPEDIVGYYDKNDKYHKNPPKSFSERLRILFTELFDSKNLAQDVEKNQVSDQQYSI